MKAKSNDLSAAVQLQFGFNRQMLDHSEVGFAISKIDELQNLINYNVRDTLYIAQLLNVLEVLPHCLHISQLTGCPWSRVILGLTSPRCEALLLKYFFNHGFVLPERVMTNQRREPAYPGGMVLQPKRGFYETCICALDYISLYPSIIREYNICFTTLNLTNPDVASSMNNPRKGILPILMEDLLTQRAAVKDSIESSKTALKALEEQITTLTQRMEDLKTEIDREPISDDRPQSKPSPTVDGPMSDDRLGLLFDDGFFIRKSSEFGRNQTVLCTQISNRHKVLDKRKAEVQLELQRMNTQQEALKIIANAVYGYLGYRHSRFHCNNIAALITQQGRMILQKTIEIVEKTGRNTVVYGDTDSVMIDSGTADVSEAMAIAQSICESVSAEFKYLRLGIEGVFLKMLLVQKKRYVVLAYDGPGQSHQESKGIELIRRDWCGLTKYMSAFILDQFLHCDDKDDAIENIISELSRIAEMMRNDGKPSNDGIPEQARSHGPSLDSVEVSTSSKSDKSSSPKTILSMLGFPQMYGVRRFRTTADRQAPIGVPLKAFSKPAQHTPASILRHYGFSDSEMQIHRITIEHLTIHMTLSRPLEKYQDRMTPHVLVAQRMVARGEHVSPNMTIAFVIAKTDDREIGSSARIPDEVAAVSELDVEWYLSNQVMAPIWRLCEPFGGMDPRMISMALGLTIPESYMPAQRDECVAVIVPHTVELQYSCGNCGERIEVNGKLADHLVCKKCRFVHQWKYVANRITEVVRTYLRGKAFYCDAPVCKFRTTQLPVSGRHVTHRATCAGKLAQEVSCVEIFNTLTYFASVYERTRNREDQPFEQYRAYVYDVLSGFLGLHGFSKITLSSIFSQSSDTSCSDSDLR
jgi:DNA polymerase alpha subunit A